jgi:hypothetical protein
VTTAPLPGAARVLSGASIRQGIREHMSGHTSAYVSIRLHMSACVSIREHTCGKSPSCQRTSIRQGIRQGIRQHTSAYLRAIFLLVSADELRRAHRRCALLEFVTRLFSGARRRRRRRSRRRRNSRLCSPLFEFATRCLARKQCWGGGPGRPVGGGGRRESVMRWCR